MMVAKFITGNLTFPKSSSKHFRICQHVVSMKVPKRGQGMDAKAIESRPCKWSVRPQIFQELIRQLLRLGTAM
jgi:hypothetical protein